jgi:hypothetical protein
LFGWKQSEFYERKVDTPDELLTLVLDAAARIKKREDQIRRTTRHLRTGFSSGLISTVGYSNIYCEL